MFLKSNLLSKSLHISTAKNILFFDPFFGKKIQQLKSEGLLHRSLLKAPSKLNTQASDTFPVSRAEAVDAPRPSERKRAKTIYTTITREAPGRRRQVQGIMILLYGAGGEPSGGEIPMNPKPIGCLMTSHSVWGLRTNNTHFKP